MLLYFRVGKQDESEEVNERFKLETTIHEQEDVSVQNGHNYLNHRHQSISK